MHSEEKQTHNYTWKDIFELIRQDVAIIAATYIIVAVYCFICLRLFGDMEENERQAAMIQLCVDSIVPTTITLALTGIIQSFFSEKRHINNFFHVVCLIGMMVFTMLTAGCHPINDKQGLSAVIIGTVIVMVLNLGMVFEEKVNPKMGLGVSGSKE